MKKRLILLPFLVIILVFCLVPAAAAVNNTVKVGLRYGSSAMSSANLENTQSGGFSVGYYDSARNFQYLGGIGDTAVTMTPADTLGGSCGQSGPYSSFDEARSAASANGGWPAYIGGSFYARWHGGGGGAHSSTGVAVTNTGSASVLFEFDCQGIYNLAVVPDSSAAWFRGYKYSGGFEYPRVTGGGLYVINVLPVEAYVKGVLPYEMGPAWPSAALEAQAVCARTYALEAGGKHLGDYGFDLCNTTDCQVYNGLGSGSSGASAATDAAVDATAGQCVYYGGQLAQTVYHASDGGATESAENVWNSPVGYLIGKADPYEASISIPNYAYTVTYTPAELTWVLQNSGYSIGTVQSAHVTERTPTGNVYKVTFVDTTGKELTVKGETCRLAFYSTTYQKNVRSMRFTINGEDGGTSSYYVNGAGTALPSLSGAYTISGSGTVSAYSGSAPYAITASGTAALTTAAAPAASGSSDSFLITGTGNGHNVGMSQYGAKAMAEQGMSYQDILNFYYTDITIR